MEKKTGTCCAGTFCTTPHLQLWSSGHSCSICKGIVHLNGVCSVASLDENGDDVNNCAACLFKNLSNSSSTPINTTNETTQCIPVQKAKSAVKIKEKYPCPLLKSLLVKKEKMGTKSVVKIKEKHPCPKCGGTDHQRSSSRKCKFNTKKSNKKSTSSNTSSKIITTTNTPKFINTTAPRSDERSGVSSLKVVVLMK